MKPEDAMTATRDVQGAAKRVLIVASNPAISGQTGWPIGFWWAELTHPYWEFVEHGYEVVIASPDGGALQGDSYSDPEDESGYSAEDLISLGFTKSPTHRAMIENTVALSDVVVGDFDAGRRHAIGGRQDLDRLRQFGGGLRRFLRRNRDPAVSDRGRGQQDGRHQFHREFAVQAFRGARRQPDHRAAAILRGCRGPAADRGTGRVNADVISAHRASRRRRLGR